MESQRFALLPRDHTLRGQVERSIARVYAAAYGARLTAFPEMLAALIDGDGVPVCAAGLRTANDGFFSDHYMDEPLTRCLGRLSDQQSIRVIEVCNFAAFRHCAGRDLLERIIDFSLDAGADWAVFTATAPLRRLLASAQLPIVRLVEARRERVPNPDSWGTYYDHDPWVCAISRRSLGRSMKPEVISSCTTPQPKTLLSENGHV